MENKKTNPKQQYGERKPPLTQFPLTAQIQSSLAFYDGYLKYGWRNWRDQPVEAQIYIDAALRHLRLFEEGEDLTRDSKIHNLGAVIACCAILIDAQSFDSLIDNRKKNPAAADMLHDAEKNIQFLKELRGKTNVD